MSSEYTISRPYAKAAFEHAMANDKLVSWFEMLEGSAMIVQNKDFARLLKDPTVPSTSVLELLFSVGQTAFDEDFKNFLSVLSENKRLSFLPHIFKHYEKLRSQAEQVVNVELTSAFPLSESHQLQFADVLKKRMKCEVILTCKSDQSILAGAVIKAGDLVIDGSLRGKIARLSDAMGIF